ncbi:MAG: glutamate racemase [Hydrogenophaga sp.]|nr:glutamate racemase [Hydrogenophaga sp.]
MKTIGVFDSGVGGLSVLRALLAEIPEARFVYVSDSAHAPYGARPPSEVLDRALHITRQLRSDHAIDALVVACNTATAHAVDALRAGHAGLPVVGVEPALKPAALMTRTGHVGVLATTGTVHSGRFQRLLSSAEAGASQRVHFSVQACEGLADAIECFDEARTRRLCVHYLAELHRSNPDLPPIDALVLGCTHYPFAAHLLAELCGPAVALVETGAPVARRTRAVLPLDAFAHEPAGPAPLLLLSSGPPDALSNAADRWLGRREPVNALPF